MLGSSVEVDVLNTLVVGGTAIDEGFGENPPRFEKEVTDRLSVGPAILALPLLPIDTTILGSEEPFFGELGSWVSDDKAVASEIESSDGLCVVDLEFDWEDPGLEDAGEPVPHDVLSEEKEQTLSVKLESVEDVSLLFRDNVELVSEYLRPDKELL